MHIWLVPRFASAPDHEPERRAVAIRPQPRAHSRPLRPVLAGQIQPHVRATTALTSSSPGGQLVAVHSPASSAPPAAATTWCARSCARVDVPEGPRDRRSPDVARREAAAREASAERGGLTRTGRAGDADRTTASAADGWCSGRADTCTSSSPRDESAAGRGAGGAAQQGHHDDETNQLRRLPHPAPAPGLREVPARSRFVTRASANDTKNCGAVGGQIHRDDNLSAGCGAGSTGVGSTAITVMLG